jgi:hypothetical protein
MQLASNALQAGDKVVWIDTGAPIPGPRFKEILNSYSIPSGQDPPSSPPTERSIEDLLQNFTYFNVHTLPHLLVLFLHPTTKFPPGKTALIIIDNVSAPFATAFPRAADAKAGSLDMARKNRLQWAANRKWAVAGDLATAMSKMAAVKNVAILAINQEATSLRGVKRAVLKPAISGATWDAAIHNRVVMWRDFAPPTDEVDQSIAGDVRFAKVVKVGGRPKAISADEAVPFMIQKACFPYKVVMIIPTDGSKGGLRELNLALPPKNETPAPVPATSLKISTKRKADEIADSEGEGDELGSDHDFGLPDDDLFNEAVLDEGRMDQNGRNVPD